MPITRGFAGLLARNCPEFRIGIPGIRCVIARTPSRAIGSSGSGARTPRSLTGVSRGVSGMKYHHTADVGVVSRPPPCAVDPGANAVDGRPGSGALHVHPQLSAGCPNSWLNVFSVTVEFCETRNAIGYRSAFRTVHRCAKLAVAGVCGVPAGGDAAWRQAHFLSEKRKVRFALANRTFLYVHPSGLEPETH